MGELLDRLFRLQDLKGDNLLEEEELAKLNEKIAIMRYGKDIDRDAVKTKYRELFREKLDAHGRPVDFSTLRSYMIRALHEARRFQHISLLHDPSPSRGRPRHKRARNYSRAVHRGSRKWQTCIPATLAWNGVRLRSLPESFEH